MASLNCFFGALKSLLCCQPQDSSERHRYEQLQSETRPHRISVPPPARSSLSYDQRAAVRLPAPYQPQHPQYELEPSIFAPPAKLQQRPSQSQWVDQNQVDGQNDPCQPYYLLRDRAIKEGDAMAKSFQGRDEARANGNTALAKELSNKGERHRSEMEKLNKEASEGIFAEKNKNRQPGEVDLHGLYVKEAIIFTDRSIQEARNRGSTQIRLIVGKGRHALDGPKVKPAISEHMQKCNLVATEDLSNTGVLIVSLDGRALGVERIVRSVSPASSLDYPSYE